MFKIEVIMKMEKWYVAVKKADFEAWSQKFDISVVTARIIRNRGLLTEQDVVKYLYGGLEDMYSCNLFKDMDQAVEVLQQKIEGQKTIRVIGDYDVDGICATYILTRGLRAAGAHVDTAIPHRIRDGYGLSKQLIIEAQEAGVDTILTCDNGIGAAPQIAYANELGMTVVVTDHHEVPYVEEDGTVQEVLPPAAAVVDPKRAECTYPYPNICGAMVAYKLIQALYEAKEQECQGLLEELLQYAAIATVCDVMELLDENRIVVKEGLKRLRKNPPLGLLALMEVNGIEPERLSAYHIGFIIGPCMNATGRLDTAQRMLELLECTQKREALAIAAELKQLNESRKLMTQEGVKEAERYVLENEMEQDKVLVIFLPDSHESLSGIIAGRIREQFQKPVFVLSRGEEGVKGSGRSIEAYSMYESMAECKDLFTKFGGHKLAAGLSMEEKAIPTLRRRLNDGCTLTEEDFIPKVHIDIPMPLAMADKQLVQELEVLAPFGVANPRPLFARKDVRLISGKKVGAKENVGKYTIQEENGKVIEVIYFGDLVRFHSFLDEKYGVGSSERLYVKKCDFIFSLTYSLSINTYKGREEVQVVMQNFC